MSSKVDRHNAPRLLVTDGKEFEYRWTNVSLVTEFTKKRFLYDYVVDIIKGDEVGNNINLLNSID